MNDIIKIVLPIVISAIVSAVIGFLVSKRKQIVAQNLAIQSLLRDRLYQIYHYCKDKGYANIDDRNNFENLYQNYHTLGKDGVMDDIHKKFLALPDCNKKGK